MRGILLKMLGLVPLCYAELDNQKHIYFFRLKTHVTLITLIWFVPSVCAHMSCKTNILMQSLITLDAMMCFLFSVFPHVVSKLNVS